MRRQVLCHQSGRSAIEWLVIISVFSFVLLVFSRLGSHYIDHYYVVSALKSLSQDPEFPRMSKVDVKSKLDKFFLIDGVRGTPTKSVKIKKGSRSTVVTIEYQERIEFFYNVDVVLSFHNVLDSTKLNECCDPPQSP